MTFSGKFANWERLDATLRAAAIYEKEFPDIATIIEGSGPEKVVAEYEDLAKVLGLQRTFFVGTKASDQSHLHTTLRTPHNLEKEPRLAN